MKFLIDLGIWCLAPFTAFFVRIDWPIPEYGRVMLVYGLITLPVKAGLIWSRGLHRQSWRSVGVRDLLLIVRVIGLATLVLYAICFLMYPIFRVPRSVPLIEGSLALLGMGGARLLSRLLSERRQRRAAPAHGRNVLIVGAGEAGVIMARELLRHPESGLVPVGFLDDEPAKAGQRYVGLPVLGTIGQLPEVARISAADEVLIAIPSAPGSVVRRVVELSQTARLRHRIIPGVYQILSGKVSISQIREVDLEDLLRRDPVRLNLEEIAGYLKDRVVLVTGAGGSIGSEIVRQVARFRPRRLILLGRGENSIFLIEQELRRAWPELEYQTVIADVRDHVKLERVFDTHRPQVVFHAAAHKHVPLMEIDPDEAVLNNVGGTRNVADLALKFGIERLVNISTDKAVNPTSVMGASKRVAEFLVQRAARLAAPGQRFVSVRFGNVLGSRGSVIPLFREQIRLGGPITVTDARMTRYFMTIPEASQLVLQAGGLADNGAVCVLDMGEPVRIVDLAHDLIRLSGFEVGKDIEVVYSGLRPGEKLFEELLTAEEGTSASKHAKILVARGVAPSDATLEADLEHLFRAARERDERSIRRALSKVVPSARLENTGAA
jgi:FlaA1/EpsC-like NDP-sugar epimerase